MFWPEDEGVEEGADDEVCGEGSVPVVAVLEWMVRENVIGDGDEDDVEANDDEGANGEVGDDWWSKTVQGLASIEHAKEE